MVLDKMPAEALENVQNHAQRVGCPKPDHCPFKSKSVIHAKVAEPETRVDLRINVRQEHKSAVSIGSTDPRQGRQAPFKQLAAFCPAGRSGLLRNKAHMSVWLS